MREFWSGDLGLTLITISMAILIFVITPLREAGLRGRLFFELVVVVLMIYAALTIKQSHLARALVIAVVLVCGVGWWPAASIPRRFFISRVAFSSP
jgi:hypothetical protein